MPLQLIKGIEEHYKSIGKGTTQLLVEGDLIVSDIKPDIGGILKVSARPVIEEEKTADDRVGFKGNLCINIIYMAKKSEKLIHNMVDALAFEDLIKIDGVSRQSDVDVSCELSHIEYKLINDRKVGIKAIITVNAQGFEQEEDSYLQDVEGDGLEFKKECFSTQVRTQNKKDRFVIKETLKLGASKPEISHIIENDVRVSGVEFKPIRGGIGVKGEVIADILYINIDEDPGIEQVEFIVPFNGNVDLAEINEMSIPYGNIKIEKIESYIISNEDGEDKIIDLEITLSVSVGAMQNKEINYVEDIYSLCENLETQKKTYITQNQTGKNEARINIRDTIILDSYQADIMQVIKGWASCYVDTAQCSDGGITIEGGVALQIMYIAKDDSSPVRIEEFMMSFEQTIELKGANADSELDIVCKVEKVNINMLSVREVDVSVTLVIDAIAYENEEREIIDNITTGETKAEELGAIVIYFVKKGDTLWDIGKKYGTSLSNIIEVNELENSRELYPGQKLIIIKSFNE